MPDNGKPYRDIPIETGDRVAVDIQGELLIGTAMVSGSRITVHRWLPGDPIPYDAMRAILGLPDVKEDVERERRARELAASWARLSDRIKSFSEALAELTLPKASHTPPMWANNPTQTRRARKTRNHRRVK